MVHRCCNAGILKGNCHRLMVPDDFPGWHEGSLGVDHRVIGEKSQTQQPGDRSGNEQDSFLFRCC
jgi:hypothetical protein